MTNIILALFIYQPGTPVTIINPSHYAGCKGIVKEVEEVKDVMYYNVQLTTCSTSVIKYITDKDFSTP